MVGTRSGVIRGKASDGQHPVQRLGSYARPAKHVHGRVPEEGASECRQRERGVIANEHLGIEEAQDQSLASRELPWHGPATSPPILQCLASKFESRRFRILRAGRS